MFVFNHNDSLIFKTKKIKVAVHRSNVKHTLVYINNSQWVTKYCGNHENVYDSQFIIGNKKNVT